jgi:hypothetical protein
MFALAPCRAKTSAAEATIAADTRSRSARPRAERAGSRASAEGSRAGEGRLIGTLRRCDSGVSSVDSIAVKTETLHPGAAVKNLLAPTAWPQTAARGDRRTHPPLDTEDRCALEQTLA